AGRRALLNLLPIFLLFIPVFWAIFGQTGSSWVLQAAHMDRQFLGVQWYEAQIQVANPILILLFIPLFSYVVYPLAGQFCQVTPLRKMSVGLVLAAAAFAISGWLEVRIESGEQPSIGWQLVAYMVLTAAEVLVSITSLEFAYTQAPPAMKSVVMGIYFAGVALGNLLTSGINWMIQRSAGASQLAGANYYWFFTGLMTLAAVCFVLFTLFYRGNTFVQGSQRSGEQ
ncbi:MAG: MFS transporter, partial [Planctomycetaceae bacterium]|nr:MFS transporter [Planctomycetaceae bacterium]